MPYQLTDTHDQCRRGVPVISLACASRAGAACDDAFRFHDGLALRALHAAHRTIAVQTHRVSHVGLTVAIRIPVARRQRLPEVPLPSNVPGVGRCTVSTLSVPVVSTCLAVCVAATPTGQTMDAALARKIGNAARGARKALSLTQEDAAERIGISLEFYGRIERGGTLPSVPTLLLMAEALDTSTDTLLGRDTSRSHPSAGTAVPTEPPELRRLFRRLRRARPKTVKLLSALVAALER